MFTTPRSIPFLVCIALLVAAVGVPLAAGQESGTVVGRPDLSLSATETEFDPGEEGKLRIVVSNDARLQRGGPATYEERVKTARGVKIEVLDRGLPVDAAAGTTVVGSVPEGSVAAPPIDLTIPEGTPPGTYRLPVEVSYTYTAGVQYGAAEPTYNDYNREERMYVTIRVTDQARFEVVDTTTGAQVGDTADLSVTVENVGSEPAHDAGIQLSSPSDEVTFGSGSGSSTAYVDVWQPGERHELDYTVAVRDDAAVRSYTLDAVVAYEDVDGIARESAPLSVGLRPGREQTFALQNVTSSLRVGEEGRFAATVINRGPDRARSPVVAFRTANSNVEPEPETYAVPTLAPGERARVVFDVTVSDAATASDQQVDLTVRYRNARGDQRASDPLERRVRVAPQRDRFVVEPVDETVTAGGSGPFRLRITNNGTEPLETVELKVFAQSPLSSGDDEAIVDRLAPNESATVTIGLGAGASALEKSYPLSVDFQYERPDGDTEVSRTYTVPVSLEPQTGGGLPLIPALVVVALVAGGGVVVWRRQRR